MKTKEQLQAQLNEIQAAINEMSKPKTLEVNRWYDHNYTDTQVYKAGNKNNYGIRFGKWKTDLNCTQVNEWTPMTNSEIIEKLKAECEKRGIREGVTVSYESIGGYKYCDNNTLEKTNKFTYHEDSDEFFIGGWIVYEKGQFATPVKDELKVEYSNGGVFLNDCWTNKESILLIKANINKLDEIIEGFNKK